MAVNVTLVPEQIVPDGLAAMLTLTGEVGLTVAVMAFEVAGEPVAQLLLDVRTQLITSPLANAELE